jgi:hypothetical protein
MILFSVMPCMKNRVHFVVLVPCILYGLVHLLVNKMNCPQCSFVRQFFRKRAAGSPKATSLTLSNTLIYHIIKNKSEFVQNETA